MKEENFEPVSYDIAKNDKNISKNINGNMSIHPIILGMMFFKIVVELRSIAIENHQDLIKVIFNYNFLTWFLILFFIVLSVVRKIRDLWYD